MTLRELMEVVPDYENVFLVGKKQNGKHYPILRFEPLSKIMKSKKCKKYLASKVIWEKSMRFGEDGSVLHIIIEEP